MLSAEQTPALSASPTVIDSAESYGLGTFVISASVSGGHGVSVGHAGDIDGYHCMAFYFPSVGRTLAVVVDSDAVDPNAVFGQLMDVALE